MTRMIKQQCWAGRPHLESGLRITSLFEIRENWAVNRKVKENEKAFKLKGITPPPPACGDNINLLDKNTNKKNKIKKQHVTLLDHGLTVSLSPQIRKDLRGVFLYPEHF
jgi:hypothetical protein